MNDVTHGHLLNGRVRYTQPAQGFRSGIEPVLLAASIPARAGERVLEGGTGAGAALLCLLTRVPSVEAVGIEIDAGQAELGRANAAANGFSRMSVVTGDIEATPLDGAFDHAFANPPYHRTSGTSSPNQAKAAAKRAAPDLLTVWAKALARPLRAGGTLTLILPAFCLPACMAAMASARCPTEAVLPLWPGLGQSAKLTIVRGIKLGRSPMRLLPGLALHEADGRFTPAADAILREVAALSLTY